MAKLKVPSLQHLARLSKSDPAKVTKGLLSLLDNSPRFSYAPLYGFLRDLLVFKTLYEQVVETINRANFRHDAKSRYLEILPLAKKFFDSRVVDFANPVAPRYYFVDRDLEVPFTPPMVFGSEGKIYFPWFIFWKKNPLKDESLSLFVTMVEEILIHDSDLDEAEFLIVDLSAERDPMTGLVERTLRVVSAKEVERLSDSRKIQLLKSFAEGFRQAKMLVEQRPKVEKDVVRQDRNPDQPDLWS